MNPLVTTGLSFAAPNFFPLHRNVLVTGGWHATISLSCILYSFKKICLSLSSALPPLNTFMIIAAIIQLIERLEKKIMTGVVMQCTLPLESTRHAIAIMSSRIFMVMVATLEEKWSGWVYMNIMGTVNVSICVWCACCSRWNGYFYIKKLRSRSLLLIEPISHAFEQID